MKKELLKRRKNNKGFSLVELIIVIAIMAVLVGVLAPQFIKYVNNSKVSTDIKNGQEIASVISAAMVDGVITADKTNQAITAVVADTPFITSLGGKVPVAKVDKNYAWTYSCTIATGEVHVYLNGYEVYPDPTIAVNGAAGGYEAKYKK